MKAYAVHTEDGEVRYFKTIKKAEAYCNEWAKEYLGDDKDRTIAELRKSIGPDPREIEIE